jgi:hypothetical protein
MGVRISSPQVFERYGEGLEPPTSGLDTSALEICRSRKKAIRCARVSDRAPSRRASTRDGRLHEARDVRASRSPVSVPTSSSVSKYATTPTRSAAQWPPGDRRSVPAVPTVGSGTGIARPLRAVPAPGDRAAPLGARMQAPLIVALAARRLPDIAERSVELRRRSVRRRIQCALANAHAHHAHSQTAGQSPLASVTQRGHTGSGSHHGPDQWPVAATKIWRLRHAPRSTILCPWAFSPEPNLPFRPVLR